MSFSTKLQQGAGLKYKRINLTLVDKSLRLVEAHYAFKSCRSTLCF